MTSWWNKQKYMWHSLSFHPWLYPNACQPHIIFHVAASKCVQTGALTNRQSLELEAGRTISCQWNFKKKGCEHMWTLSVSLSDHFECPLLPLKPKKFQPFRCSSILISPSPLFNPPWLLCRTPPKHLGAEGLGLLRSFGVWAPLTLLLVLLLILVAALDHENRNWVPAVMHPWSSDYRMILVNHPSQTATRPRWISLLTVNYGSHGS